MLDLVRALFCLTCMSYASWSDLRTREISDLVWLILAPVGFSLTAIAFYVEGALPLLELMTSLALIVAISLALVALRLAGSADALALVSMALALPLYPEFAPLFKPDFYHPFLPLAALTNGILLSMIVPLALLVHNISYKLKGEPLFEGLQASWREKLIALLIGYRTDPQNLRKLDYLYPIETVERGVRKLRITVGLGERELNSLEGLEGRVWVTPGLPMVLFFTLGLLTCLLVGDFPSFLLSIFVKS